MEGESISPLWNEAVSAAIFFPISTGSPAPRLRRSIHAQAGEPSASGTGHDHWCSPRRGCTLHLMSRTGDATYRGIPSHAAFDQLRLSHVRYNTQKSPRTSTAYSHWSDCTNSRPTAQSAPSTVGTPLSWDASRRAVPARGDWSRSRGEGLCGRDRLGVDRAGLTGLPTVRRPACESV